MVNPRLSVLLSAYNAENYITEAIESILNQEFRDFELLIADDGSDDNTRLVIDSYSYDSRVRILHNEKNEGKTITINRLFVLSRGTYVTIHDADDISLELRFQKQLDLLYSDPELVMCGCSFVSFTGHGFESKGLMEADYAVLQKEILKESQFHGPTMIFKKEVIINELNGELFRPFFQDYNEDCDLAIRLSEVGVCSNLRDVLYRYRILPNSLSKTLTARKKSLYPFLVELHKQRLHFGKDYLQKGEIDQAELMLESIINKHYQDSSKIYRESAEFLMYYQFRGEAVRQAWQAVVNFPSKWVNWGTLQYCVRKYLFG